MASSDMYRGFWIVDCDLYPPPVGLAVVCGLCAQGLGAAFVGVLLLLGAAFSTGICRCAGVEFPVNGLLPGFEDVII